MQHASRRLREDVLDLDPVAGVVPALADRAQHGHRHRGPGLLDAVPADRRPAAAGSCRGCPVPSPPGPGPRACGGSPPAGPPPGRRRAGRIRWPSRPGARGRPARASGARSGPPRRAGPLQRQPPHHAQPGDVAGGVAAVRTRRRGREGPARSAGPRCAGSTARRPAGGPPPRRVRPGRGSDLLGVRHAAAAMTSIVRGAWPPWPSRARTGYSGTELNNRCAAKTLEQGTNAIVIYVQGLNNLSNRCTVEGHGTRSPSTPSSHRRGGRARWPRSLGSPGR